MKMLEEYRINPEDLKRMYFGEKDVCKDTDEDYINFQGDVQFVHGIHKIAKNQVEKSSCPTYLYKFTCTAGTKFMAAMTKATLKYKGMGIFDRSFWWVSSGLD